MVFDPFEQASLVNNAKFGGLGLRLAIEGRRGHAWGHALGAERRRPRPRAIFQVSLQGAERLLGVAKGVSTNALSALSGQGGVHWTRPSRCGSCWWRIRTQMDEVNQVLLEFLGS